MASNGAMNGAKKRVMVMTGGGDCPGLNAVIRAIVRKARTLGDWEVLGSIEAFNGILRDPMEIVMLDTHSVAGIHIRGGTILKTTNKGGPFEWPVRQADGSWTTEDRSDELIARLDKLGVEAIISIGGDGSMRIAQDLMDKGLNVVGVPKTIDNDLSSTDVTFGFQTAVEIATDAVDKLVTTAASHNRLMILEVMGRDAGWIGLSAAIAGGADVALIPEIPYDLDVVSDKIMHRMENNRGFAIVVICEGAKPVGGEVTASKSDQVGYANKLLGGVGHRLLAELKARPGFSEIDARVMILGHLQRGGTPCAYDRILATQFGVKAMELVNEGRYGEMVAYRKPKITSVTIKEAIAEYNYVSLDSDLVKTARGAAICLGDAISGEQQMFFRQHPAAMPLTLGGGLPELQIS
ncbi:MAG: ATP-dependent 6-phosphofructokinase [Vampirovibrionales bacterium]|nr:ATP-dependent 6-phosphofructokinase [Vampirovibrionales bacterium]